MKLSRMRIVWISIVMLLACGVLGCDAPSEADRDNRRLVDAILTTITLKNPRLLEENVPRAKARFEAGNFPPSNFAALEAVIARASWRLGRREHDGYAFRKRYPFVEEGE